MKEDTGADVETCDLMEFWVSEWADEALIEDFLRSQGSSIAGFNLREFGTPQTLFVERACSRAAIQ